MTDSEMQFNVLEQLRWEPIVDREKIGVKVVDGVVTLTGNAKSYGEKRTAKRAAKRMNGVKRVANEAKVKLPGSSQRTDADIARAAAQALARTLLAPNHEQIKITVSHG
jgi:hypothetical protein